jgi:nucleoside-diphosphate-sugar epimerase
MVFQLAYGLETVVLRVFDVYGSRQGFGEYGGVIAQFVRRLLVGETPVGSWEGARRRLWMWM